jgi:Uma2 family endonuclease
MRIAPITPPWARAELRVPAEEADSMAMPNAVPKQGEWTVEDMWALLPDDDGKRYEVIDGVLYVTPSPSNPHQDAVGPLYLLLYEYLRRSKAGWVRISPADVRFGPRRGVQPDVYVAPMIRGRRPHTWQDITHLLLAVEVLSPSTASRDRGVKRRLYQEIADEYWIVDIDARIVERWRPGDTRPEVLDTTLTWQPAEAAETFTLDLAAFFRDVWDE